MQEAKQKIQFLTLTKSYEQMVDFLPIFFRQPVF